ncbi:hypothetical protein QF000_006667 [Paraburkholderia atlantica]|uniref:helix-turn-helix domain-containing protein n=1 Tax=Paraburkholderia atlantica TaxID=2654982 RepID=UPI003D252B45
MTTNKANNDRDMSREAQRKRVLEYLKASPQTTYSLRARGISHPAQRIKELIELGYRIASGRVRAVDSDGFAHSNVALYSVHDREPDLVDLMAEPA